MLPYNKRLKKYDRCGKKDVDEYKGFWHGRDTLKFFNEKFYDRV